MPLFEIGDNRLLMVNFAFTTQEDTHTRVDIGARRSATTSVAWVIF